MCTSIFSLLEQCLIYIENWNMVKPSSIIFLRKPAATLRSFGVSVGKSKNTSIHKILYSLSRIKRVQDIQFFGCPLQKILPMMRWCAEFLPSKGFFHRQLKYPL